MLGKDSSDELHVTDVCPSTVAYDIIDPMLAGWREGLSASAVPAGQCQRPGGGRVASTF